jgi:hypothetical protein
MLHQCYSPSTQVKAAAALVPRPRRNRHEEKVLSASNSLREGSKVAECTAALVVVTSLLDHSFCFRTSAQTFLTFDADQSCALPAAMTTNIHDT